MKMDKEEIRARMLSFGFADCGFTTADELECAPILDDWVARERHGYMDYLARGSRARTHPADLLAGARTVIVCAWRYAAPPSQDPFWRENLTGRVAAYALGADYHLALGDRLREAGEYLARHFDARTAVHVDAGPLVEKDLARRAGVGWYGRNTNVIGRSIGSFTLLACLVTDLRIEPDRPFEADHCGTCRDCIPACPTGALDDGPTIDARRCISYLTIELRGPIATEFRPLLGNWVFGCDDCQTVCPWNDESAFDPATISQLRPALPELLALDESGFRARFGATAISRTKRAGLARNAAVVLGNTRNPGAIEPLDRALRTDPSPLVRSHAAWALGRIGGRRAKAALAAAGPQVPPVEAEIASASIAASVGPAGS